MTFYWTENSPSSSWRVQLQRKWVLTPAGANVPDKEEEAYQPIRSFVDKIKSENNAVTLTLDVNTMEEPDNKKVQATLRLYDNSKRNIMEIMQGSLDDNPSVCKYTIYVKFAWQNKEVIFDDFQLPKDVPVEKKFLEAEKIIEVEDNLLEIFLEKGENLKLTVEFQIPA